MKNITQEKLKLSDVSTLPPKLQKELLVAGTQTKKTFPKFKDENRQYFLEINSYKDIFTNEKSFLFAKEYLRDRLSMDPVMEFFVEEYQRSPLSVYSFQHGYPNPMIFSIISYAVRNWGLFKSYDIISVLRDMAKRNRFSIDFFNMILLDVVALTGKFGFSLKISSGVELTPENIEEELYEFFCGFADLSNRLKGPRRTMPIEPIHVIFARIKDNEDNFKVNGFQKDLYKELKSGIISDSIIEIKELCQEVDTHKEIVDNIFRYSHTVFDIMKNIRNLIGRNLISDSSMTERFNWNNPDSGMNTSSGNIYTPPFRDVYSFMLEYDYIDTGLPFAFILLTGLYNSADGKQSLQFS